MSKKAQEITIGILSSIATLGLVYLLCELLTKRKSTNSSTADLDDKKTPDVPRINPNSSNLLFVGDSLTVYTNSFADQLKKQYPNINITKVASVGKQTSWMLPQLQQELLTGKKYNGIIFTGGVNDIYATNSIINAKSNLQKMYDIAKNSGALVIALNVLPTATYSLSNAKTTQLTNDLNSWIRTNKTVDILVDINSLLNNGKDGTKLEYLQPDKLHLNDLAHSVIKNELANKIIK